MSKCILIIVLFYLLAATSQAQNSYEMEWQYSLGSTGNEWGKKILRTAEGDYVVLGDVNSAGDGDLPPIKGWQEVGIACFSKWGERKWVKTFGMSKQSGTYQWEATNFSQTSDGGFIITGSYWFLSHGTYKENKIFALKMDRDGNVQWSKTYAGASGWGIREKSDGSYILVGVSTGDCPGGENVIVTGLDGEGNELWRHCLNGSNTDRPYELKLTKDGGFVITGYTESLDGDFVTNHGVNFTSDAFVIKFNSANQIEWSQCFGGSHNDRFNTIVEDAKGNFWAAGHTQSEADGDITEPSKGGGYDIRLVKINSSGKLVKQKRLTGSWEEWIQSLVITSNGDLAVCGLVNSTDGDFLANKNGHRFWVATLDSAKGQIKQQAWFGGWDYVDGASDIVEDPDGGLVVVGSVKTPNPYVVGYKGGLADIWIMKLRSAVNTIKATIYSDLNANGVKDSNEPAFNDAYVKVKKGVTDSALISYKDGSFSINTDTGRYTVSVIPNRSFNTPTPAFQQTTFTTYNNKDSFAFGIIPTANVVDLSVNAWAPGRARMGNKIVIWIKYTNTGTTAANAVLKFVKDPRTTVDNLSQSWSQQGDTLQMPVPDLKPNESREIQLVLEIGVPPQVTFGDTLSHQVSIAYSGADFLSADNEQLFKQPIMAAFDPNDKRELTLPGKIDIQQLQDKKSLAYQIRFQNVGNDTAFNIVVRDTIEDKLDINTLEMVAADHPYSMRISQGKFIEWTFKDILLPDSNVNEPLSHGYIIYRIQPKRTLKIGDIITNSASIYFDYNPPVKTNDELTAVSPAMPHKPVISGIDAIYCSVSGVQKGKIMNLPAATAATNVSVLLDNSTLPIAADSTFGFDPAALAEGQHSIEVIYTNTTGIQSTIIHFNIQRTQTPVVSVTSNMVSVVGTPVLLTATHIGGGSSPLYTFARDRKFTSLWQPESVFNTLTIQASSLSIGDNWIYVRLRSNATCLSEPTSLDSILIKREVATGIVDPDNPGRMIIISPNPFINTIIVKGLDAGKKYQIVLADSKGQIVYSREVKNKQVLEIPVANIIPGLYLLTIYNDRSRRLGTEKIMKY